MPRCTPSNAAASPGLSHRFSSIRRGTDWRARGTATPAGGSPARRADRIRQLTALGVSPTTGAIAAAGHPASAITAISRPVAARAIGRCPPRACASTRRAMVSARTTSVGRPVVNGTHRSIYRRPAPHRLVYVIGRAGHSDIAIVVPRDRRAGSAAHRDTTATGDLSRVSTAHGGER